VGCSFGSLPPLRTQITMRLGLHVVAQAKSADIPYSEVRRKAKWLWPLWAY
jgi:kynurenine 3-monooxygenase